MLKARSGDKLIFGLSARNIELLMDGRPILIDLKPLGAEGEIVIFYGTTEAAMKEQLEEAGIELDKEHKG